MKTWPLDAIIICLVFGLASGDDFVDNNAVLFDGCDLDEYYAELLSISTDVTAWTRSQLNLLVTDTHRNILPLKGPVAGADDVYNAMIDLDYGSVPDSVQLIYRDLNMNATPNANPLYWERELLWPRERGSGEDIASLNDIHHLRPADATVLQKKGLLSFGTCSTVQLTELCEIPATDETAPDTAQDGKIWTPPVRFRGDVARALFYMDLRYDYLTLKDCGPFDNNAMGYLSELLQWHRDDPVDDQERARSARACDRWQGNRNPFIDHPELATSIYGEPSRIIGPGVLTYESCLNVPTPSPTATPDACATLAESGDVPLFLLNSDDPDVVVFLPLVDIAPMVLYLTDKAFDGDALVTAIANEGTLKWTVPTTISAGDTFGYGTAGDVLATWEVVDGTFSLQDDGDNVFLYCRDADDLVRFISAFTFAGEGWYNPGLSAEQYGTKSTALPPSLVQYAISLQHFDNYYFNGTRDVPTSVLKSNMQQQDLWVGDDEGRFEVANSAALVLSQFLWLVLTVPVTLLWL